MTPEDLFADAPVIYAYTRAQALDDGVLIDVSETAREAGITFPTAVTCRVWNEVVVPPLRAKARGESEEGRLWDVIWLLRCAIAKARAGADVIHYQLIATDERGRKKTRRLSARCGPGDTIEPVITVMLDGES